ncbi:hypothetical protein BJX99DRAFT_263645 [Aspergillus californicus]
MPVTALTCLRVKNGLPLSDPANIATLNDLRLGLLVQSARTNTPAYLLAGVEDPAFLYILAPWDSVSQHVDEWIPSPTFQMLIETIAAEIEGSWLRHFDCDLLEHRDEATGDASLCSVSMVCIRRYLVSQDNKGGFDGAFDRLKHDMAAGRGVCGGWAVNRDVQEGDVQGGDAEEFIMLSWMQTTEVGLDHRASMQAFSSEVHIQHATWFLPL